MNIYDRSKRTILTLMEKSTGYLYWPAEVRRQTGLSKPTIYRDYSELSKAGFVREKLESVTVFMDHPPRKFYELTDYGLAAIRLTPLSSI